MPPKRRGPWRLSSSWPGSISPWKMWPPVMPKRCSSSRGPSARRPSMRSGRPGQTSAKRAMAASAAASASASPGKHWQKSETTCLPGGASVESAAVWHAASIHGRAAGRPARASAAAAREVGEREADVDRPVPRLLARPRRKVGEPVEEQHDLDDGAGLAPAAGAASRRAAARPPARRAARAHRVRIGEHRPRRHLAAVLEHQPDRRSRPPPAAAPQAPRGAPALRPPPPHAGAPR